ncbi:uncharacterized protein LOC143275054 [Babylonia areolata]|uniref:uncharacterized protein LOC143275054 n=1 Tax=Babylonia areolata TaxID=304850 RepID=UPI003FD1C586
MRKGRAGGRGGIAGRAGGPEVEADFTSSRAGLGTHRKNTAERHRLEDRLRSLDLLQRQAALTHRRHERHVLHGLLTPAPLPPHRPPASSSVPRRGSLQLEADSQRCRRPSIVLQEAAGQPVLDLSDDTWATPPSQDDPHHHHTTIIDMLAARNKPRSGARRASVGGGAGGGGGVGVGEGSGVGAELTLLLPDTSTSSTSSTPIPGQNVDRLDLTLTPTPTPTPRPSPSPISSSGSGSGSGSDAVIAADLRAASTRGRRGSVTTGPEPDTPTPLLPHRPREGQARVVAAAEWGAGVGAGGDRKPVAVAARARRPSVDVDTSLLSPGLSPGLSPLGLSRLGSRRSSLASSQGTPSTPSTPDPDSKSRDGTSFAFPPVSAASLSSRRHSCDVRPPLLRRHSSDTLVQAQPAASRHAHVTGSAATSQGRHRRNSSLKLPRMQQGGRRKSVVPCVNNMLLLHGVLQNSSSFMASDFQEDTS